MSSGPIPKRSDQRRRRNVPDGPETVKGAAGAVPDIPEPLEHWHAIARDWYLSLAESGQSQFYEASDWTFAVYVAEAMSRNLASGKFSAQLFQSVHAAMTELLTSEGSRRRARIELERFQEAPPEDPTVAIMADYKRAAGK